MSLLAALRAKRKVLKPTTTTLTLPDGRQFEITPEKTAKSLAVDASTRSPGYVVDTTPDAVPALIADSLYLGSQDACATIKEYGITHVLSVGIPAPVRFDDVTYKFVPLLDLPETALGGILDECVRFIQCCAGGKVLVHCNAGVSRSAAVVVGYLMLVHKLNFEDSFSAVKGARGCARPNDGFLKQLRELGAINERPSRP